MKKFGNPCGGANAISDTKYIQLMFWLSMFEHEDRCCVWCVVELRIQERVFMGTGRKPFMDIQPNEAAICDRAANCVLLGRGNKSTAKSQVPYP